MFLTSGAAGGKGWVPMAPDLLLTIVTALLGVLTAAILALINSWISTRAGLDENLREQRLRHYPALWGGRGCLPMAAGRAHA